MSSRAVSSRFGLARVAVGWSACLLLACVNRGAHEEVTDELRDAAVDRSHVPDARVDRGGAGGAAFDSGGDAARDATTGAGGSGAGGSGGHATGGSGAGGSGAGGRGSGGATGTGGRGAGGSGAGGSIADAGPGDVPRVCSARFNFENGNLSGAFINSGFQTAFSNLAHASDAACGSGSLDVAVALSSSSTKGELILPLGDTENLAGKTVSLSVKMTPQEAPNAYVIVFAVPSYAFITSFSAPVPTVWTNSTVTLPGNSAATATTAISIQLIGQGDTYSGALFVDEVDVR